MTKRGSEKVGFTHFNPEKSKDQAVDIDGTKDTSDLALEALIAEQSKLKKKPQDSTEKIWGK